MADPISETSKRLDLSYKEAEKLKSLGALGVILTGSVVYSPNFNVTEKSDVDILAVFPEIKGTIDDFIRDPEESKALKNRTFDGYSFKTMEKSIPVSVHIISADAFDIVSKCFVADIRLYRPIAKEETYLLYDFEGNVYNYKIKNIALNDLKGVRTIVPVSFINNDRYFLGIHRDKLLSNPKILYESNNYVETRIDKLWHVIIQTMKDESSRKYGKINLEKVNILNALSRKDKMSCEVINKIIENQNKYLLNN